MSTINERLLSQAVDRAQKEIRNGRFSRAVPILEAVLAKVPESYSHSEERDGTLFVRFWGAAAFLDHVEKRIANGTQERVVWIPNAFPRAAYLLGYIAVERGRFAEAIAYFDRGLQLQPQCAPLVLEKAFALRRLGLHSQASSLLEEALCWKDALSESDRAEVLKGLDPMHNDNGQVGELAPSN